MVLKKSTHYKYNELRFKFISVCQSLECDLIQLMLLLLPGVQCACLSLLEKSAMPAVRTLSVLDMLL